MEWLGVREDVLRGGENSRFLMEELIRNCIPTDAPQEANGRQLMDSEGQTLSILRIITTTCEV